MGTMLLNRYKRERKELDYTILQDVFRYVDAELMIRNLCFVMFPLQDSPVFMSVLHFLTLFLCNLMEPISLCFRNSSW